MHLRIERDRADHNLLRWFFLESIAYVLLAHAIWRRCTQLDRAPRNGCLLCGASGAGKSTLCVCRRLRGVDVSVGRLHLAAGQRFRRYAVGRPHQVRFRDDAPGLFPRLAGYAVRERPNGKIGIEVPTRAFPEIRTALRCRVGGLACLDRRQGARPAMERVEPAEVARQLLNSCSYGAEVDAMHERATRRLLDLPGVPIAIRIAGGRIAAAFRVRDAIGAGAASGVPLDVSILGAPRFGS